MSVEDHHDRTAGARSRAPKAATIGAADQIDDSVVRQAFAEAEDALEELDAGADPAIEDATPEEWLAEAEKGPVIGRVEIQVNGKPKHLLIAALTEGEVDVLVQAAKRPRGPGGRMVTNMEEAKLLQVAHSINKAYGRVDEQGRNLPNALTPRALKRQLAGHLTKVYQAMTELSGFKQDSSAVEQAQAFFE